MDRRHFTKYFIKRLHQLPGFRKPCVTQENCKGEISVKLLHTMNDCVNARGVELYPG